MKEELGRRHLEGQAKVKPESRKQSRWSAQQYQWYGKCETRA